jgi:sugar transferase (PEP-CTERM system associated)
MTKIFGHYIPVEMVVLWAVELILCFFFICFLLGTDPHLSTLGIHSPTVSRAAMLALTICLTSVAIGLYRPEACQQTGLFLLNLAVAGMLALPIIVALSATLGPRFGDAAAERLGWVAKVLVAWMLCLVVTRAIFALAVRLHLFERRILVVAAGEDGARQAVEARKGGFFQLSGMISAGEFTAILPEQLLRQRIWGIVVASSARGAIAPDDLLRCKCRGIRLFRDVDFHEQQLGRVDLERLSPDWLAFADGFSCSWCATAWRRLLDVLISLALIALTLPLMLLTALMVKLDSSGPAFYCQERAGLHGRPFVLFKFRSMVVDAEAGGFAWAAKRDARVTRVGRFIRLTRIDELPQLFNVLRGEMSFIGPRPERPHFVAQLAQVIPHYCDRHFVKPGLTGWAQVNYPYGASVEDARMKLSYDLYYVKHRSFFLDLLILFATVRVILFQEGSR